MTNNAISSTANVSVMYWRELAISIAAVIRNATVTTSRRFLVALMKESRRRQYECAQKGHRH